MSVQLIIKSAAQSVEDFNLQCDLTWTIGEVKGQISELYPTKPKKEEQKLIYGGKLLPDHLPVKSILNRAQETYILHLVCPISPKSETKSSPEKLSESTTHFASPSSNPVDPQIIQSVFSPQNLSGVPPNGSVPSFYTGDAANQYLAMQQMYAQFMAQYLSQYNASMPFGVPYAPVTLPTAPVMQQPERQEPRQNIPNPVPRQHEEDQRDYIDHVYAISRAVILSALLYYYSSFTRIMMVLMLFLCISIYVKLNRQQQEIRQRENERQTEVAASQQQPADIQTSGNDETVPESNENPVTTPAQPQSEGRSVMSVLSTIFSLWSLFFTSLIPTEPLPVNAN